MRWPPLTTSSSPWPLGPPVHQHRVHGRQSDSWPPLVRTTMTVAWNFDSGTPGLHNLLHPGCNQIEREWENEEKMEREWENEEKVEREWENEEEMQREWGNGERMSKWRESEEMEREWGNGEKVISCLFILFLNKNCHILSHNVKKNLTYALGENNSWSNSLRGSSASCAGLGHTQMAR